MWERNELWISNHYDNDNHPAGGVVKGKGLEIN
jgi:hypothetical protein